MFSVLGKFFGLVIKYAFIYTELISKMGVTKMCFYQLFCFIAHGLLPLPVINTALDK